MISKRISMLLAPWCFVFVIAISCSKQETSANRDKREAITAISKSDKPSKEQTRENAHERYQELVASESDPVKLRRSLGEFYQEWGHEDGEAAVTHAFAQNRTLVTAAFTGWLGSDKRGAREWVLAGEKSPRKQSQLAGGLLRAMPDSDDAARGEWAGHFAGSAFGAPIISEVAIGWGQSDPQAALGWLDGLLDGPARTGTIETIFKRWTEIDPELASTHLTRMPDGDAKDIAISSLAKTIHADDPEAARLWADAIADTSLRELTNSHLKKLAASGAPLLPDF